MLATILAWLTGSRAGQYVALAIVIGAAILWAFRRAYSIGKDEANAQFNTEKYKALHNALKSSKEISAMSDDERHRFVSRFLRE